ncbi:hypothetical protein PoB_007344100 [Plakobranchus ocellatus]|uniref:Uncharacterized protein n=1 Tax=Plakobranchus ocellatus TaxID=259542 RepID=A0AAV4DSY6_9GAST|nr:hypothetical protein PoB_007344100 [Plakobranchus ocellatus]
MFWSPFGLDTPDVTESLDEKPVYRVGRICECKEMYSACPQPVHNKVILGFQALLRPGRLWRGSNPRQKGSCRSQGGLASHCATETPIWPENLG